MLIANKIREIRQILNMNQKDFANVLNVKAVTLGRYELGERIPDFNFINNFITTLNINPMWIFFDAGEPILNEDSLDLSNENILILKELRLILTQEELNLELNKTLISTILTKFEIAQGDKTPIFKFLTSLKFEGHLPIRPFLFLYYIFKFINQDESRNTVTNYKEYLMNIILAYKTLSWNNNPLFTSRIKREISTKFEDEISETECQVLVRNVPLTLKTIEDIIPKGMLRYHNQVSLKSLFPSKF